MSVSPPGWMRCSSGPQDVGPLEDPDFVARSEDYLRRVVSRWWNSPALDSWILWNEPDRTIARTPATWRGYIAFIREYYENDIAEYNRGSFQQFDSFEQLAQRPPADIPIGPSFASRLDEIGWARFSVANVAAHLRRIAAIVRQIDPAHPVHLNPHRVSQCLLPRGQSLWEEGRIADFMGCSAHPVWHSMRFPRERWHQSVALFADLTRSCTRHADELFWVSELQGGPTVFTGFTADGPSSEELRQWLWEAVGAGARAIIYWSFNWRSAGYEAGEWSLLAQDGSASERLRETSAFAVELERYAEILRDTRPPAPEVLILYSEASLLSGFIDGEDDRNENPRNRQMAADALCGAYLMLSDLGREVQFVDERRLREEQLPLSAKSIVLPGCVALEPGTLEALLAFAERGGTVIADHLIAWKTPDGAIDVDARERLERLFGSALGDIRSTGIPFHCVRDGTMRVPGWFVQLTLQARPEAAVVARWENGAPAATAARRGFGRAVRIGTAFFQHYLSTPESAARRWLEELLPPSLAPVRLRSPSAAVRLRTLRGPHGPVCVVFNQGESIEVEFVVSAEGRWNAGSGGAVSRNVGGGWHVTLPARCGRIFAFDFHTASVSTAGVPPAPAEALTSSVEVAPVAALGRNGGSSPH
jgi:beta-galactosidase